MILLSEILTKVEQNTGCVFLYSQKSGKFRDGILCENPFRIAKAITKNEVIALLKELDEIRENGDFAIVQVPYEVGYLLNPIDDKNEREIKAIQVNFYKQENVREISQNELSFEGIESFFTTKPQIKNFKLTVNKEEYKQNIFRVKKHLADGNTYQINYTEIGNLDFAGNIKSLFVNGIFKQSAEYCAFINNEDEFVLSFSPELFFKTDYNEIVVKPMKGTFAKSENVEIDEKNKSENIMIVDLLRNDLGRIAKTDSVKVEKLFELEEYETLYQLTSTISAELLKPKISEIFLNIFPSGSITGAPKISSMKIINELEKNPRGIYTGAIGFVEKGESTFSVAIRTVEINKENQKGKFGLGGGIVWDSVSNAEYEEVLLKGKFLTERTIYFELLESILFENGHYFLLEEHLERMAKSSREFLFAFEKERIEKELELLKSNFEIGQKYKIRILLNKWGEVKTDFIEIRENLKLIKAKIKVCGSGRGNPLFSHKTTFRPWNKVYLQNKKLGFDETIFVDRDGYLLEGAISNILLEKGGKYFTPVSKNILSGVFLNHFIKNNEVQKVKIHKSELQNYDGIYVCNSVRKIIEVAIF